MVVTALLVLIGGRTGGIGDDGNLVGVPDDRLVLSDGWFGGVDVNLPPPNLEEPDVSGEDAGGVPVEPAPEPVAPARDYTSIPVEVKEFICSLEWDCQTALAVAWCEMGSKWAPAAWNPTPVWLGGMENHAGGMFQMLLPHHEHRFSGDYADPIANTLAAYSLWGDGGWEPWDCA